VALTPEDVRQIVDALEQLDWVQFTKSQMAAANPAPGNASPVASAVEPPAMPAPAAPAETPPPTPPVAGPPESPSPVGPPGPPTEEKDEKEKLAAQPYEAGAVKPATASVEGGETGKPAQGSVDESSNEASGEYSSATGGAQHTVTIKMSRILADQQQLRLDLQQTRDELARERYARRKSERRERLSALRMTHAFDLDESLQIADPEAMKEDEHFERYAKSLETTAAKLPYAELGFTKVAQVVSAAEMPPNASTQEKRHREASAKAMRYCKDQRMTGKHLPQDFFEQVLGKLLADEALPDSWPVSPSK
jgi:hypothetical protein